MSSVTANTCGAARLLLALISLCGAARAGESREPRVIIVATPTPFPTPTPRARGVFEEHIQRNFSGPLQEKWLLKAENTLPARRDIEKARQSSPHYRRAKTPLSYHLWWYDDFDGVRLPFAITAQGVNYYRNLLAAFRRGDFRGANGLAMSQARLDYRAVIAFHRVWKGKSRSFRNVYLATLELKWSQTCGSLCGLYIDRTRQVVISPQGKILGVFGDGITPVIVS